MLLKRFTVPLLAGMIALAGCDAPDGNNGSAEPSSDSAGVAAGSPAGVAGVDSLTAPTPEVLASINRSEVRGTARLTRSGDDLLAVVKAEGLEPGARYTTRIHEGSCADGGTVLLPLGRMTGGADGTGSLRFRAAAERLPDAERLFVQIHGEDDRAVACANIEPEGSQP